MKTARLRYRPGFGRVVLLVGILIAVISSVTAVAIFSLYNTSILQLRERLREMAQSHARLIEVLANHELRFESKTRRMPGHGSAFDATLEQVKAAYGQFEPAGRTGEFVLGLRDGDSIIQLLHSSDHQAADAIADDDAPLAVPMKRALRGESGTMVGPDYRGVTVVAAYEPVAAFGLGVVAKIDLAEVRAPFYRAGLVSIVVASVLTIIGGGLFFWLTNPLLRRISASEERYRTLFDDSPVGIYRTTPDGRILLANPSLVRMLGYDSLRDLAAVNLEQGGFAAGSPRRRFRELLEAADHLRDYEAVWQRRDGGELLLREDARCVRDRSGRVLFYDGMVEDVTERRRAEQALRDSEERFRLAFDHAGGGMTLTAPNGRLLRVNDRFAAMLGYTREELQALNYGAITHPDDVEVSIEQVRRTLAGEQSGFHTESRYRRKDGGLLWAQVVAVLQRDEAGRPVHFVTQIHDVTERKRAEAEVERKNRELEQLVYAASHDLRTPLVGVQGFVGELSRSLAELVELIRRPSPGPNDRERVLQLAETDVPQALRFIGAGVDRMDALLTGLLRLSRQERTAVRIEEVDAGAAARAAAASLEFAVRRTGARLAVGELPRCRADEQQLAQVFANLIGNALTYRDPRREPVVSVTGRVEDGESVFCVGDNGVGIAPELTAKVFEPFQRLDPKSGDGDGLGLTIVAQAVGRMGGRVWVESKPGEGSRFFVALPAAAPAAREV